MKLWGITGTNGKTTCTWILADFISAVAGRKCGYITTVEVFDGKNRFYTGYTTPPLARLKKIYAAMEANGCTDCAMEVSSHAIHQNRVDFGGASVFSGGAFTNLSEDHLDYHKTMEEYFRVKASFAAKIAECAPAPSPSSGRADLPPFVVCLDGGYGREMLDAAGALALNAIPVTTARPHYDLSRLQLAGGYNKSNVLTAAALAEAAGVPRETVQARIPLLTARWGRLEKVPSRSKAGVYVDFAHTPDGLEKVLSAAREFTDGRLWVVFGAGGDRDPMKRPLMGEAAARLADRVVATSDNPRSEDPLKIIDAVLSGIPAAARAKVDVEPDRAKAIALALANAGEGDVVVVAGKGHETTQEIKGVKRPFSDRDEISAWGG